MPNSIEITIGSQKFLLRGDESEEHLREVAELVKRKVDALRKQAPTLSLQKASMLAAFDLASLAIKGKIRALDYRADIVSRATSLLERVEDELEKGPQGSSGSSRSC